MSRLPDTDNRCDSDGESPRRTVLVVDDDPLIADLYATILDEDYAVRVETDGKSALEELDHTVDVVLLDRSMPAVDGDEILSDIRDRNLDCLVALVTARDPGLDVIDLDFDAYLVKPVEPDRLRKVVAELVERTALTDQVRDLFAIDEKIAVLESVLEPDELDSSDAFADLLDRRETLAEDVWTSFESFVAANRASILSSDATPQTIASERRSITDETPQPEDLNENVNGNENHHEKR